MANKVPSPSGKASSRELLGVVGDGSSRSVVESLFKLGPQAPRGEAPKTFKFARSSLLDQLQTFLPEIQKSNQQLLDVSTEEREALDIENIDNDENVVEMNFVLGEMGSGDESDNVDIDDEASEDDSPMLGPVTADTLKVPSEAVRGKKRGKDLITEICDASEESEGDRSDGELTVASPGSAER